MHTAHIDTFAADHLPPAGQWPEFLLDAPGLQFPAQLNCATELLDSAFDRGWGDRVCIRAPGGLVWTYRDLQAQADRIAHVLVSDMGLVSGNRVLLRAPNNPMLAACWFAVIKAGGIAVATMPLLRAKELGAIIDKAQVSHALCDLSLAQELQQAAATPPRVAATAVFSMGRACWTVWCLWAGQRGWKPTWPGTPRHLPMCPLQPPTPACWPSPAAPRGCPRPPCTVTAT
jgi:2-aminobenzoate-CoA ligase